MAGRSLTNAKRGRFGTKRASVGKMMTIGLNSTNAASDDRDEALLPDDVYIALVASLFSMMPALLISIGAVLIITGKVAFQDGRPLFWGFFAVAFLSGAARLATAMAFRRRRDMPLTKAEAVRWEQLFAITAFLSMVTAGSFILATFILTDHIPNHVLANGLGCGIAAGVTSRSAGRVWIATWQISLLLIPIVIGSFLRFESSYAVISFLALCFLIANLDISRRLNRQMVDLLLARRVRERTVELEHLNKALAQAKADAEAANISKTRFLAAASHDLLQPLNAARLYATSLREQLDRRTAASDQRTLATNVEASLEAVEDILTALLDISGLDAGATATEITCFRLNGIFRQLKVEFDPIARDRGLSLRFVPSSLPIVSDARLLRRLLQNLVSNAIKYTPHGRVIVGARHEGAGARIEVWDTGLGIPKARQRDIFREFERLPAAVATAPGLGLGLSIVERIGRILNHKVTVRSKPGRGSVFSVTARRGTMAEMPLAPALEHVDAARRTLRGLVIAVVDNERAILTGMAALLGGWNCQIVLGETYREIEKGLLDVEAIPDVIIADYHLDGDDGIAVVARLRERFGQCHAVLLTADRSPAVRDKAHIADIRILNKPIKPAALRALLSQWHLMTRWVA